MTFPELLFIPRSLGFSVEVFLHTRMGERYADVQALAVFVLVPVFAAMWPGHDPGPLLMFLLLYMVMCLRNRVEGLASRRRPPGSHSRYTGLPRLLHRFPKHSEASFKLWVEPALVLLFGGAIAIVSAPLGTYLMAAAVGLFISVLASAAVDRQLLLDLNDLVIEQQQRAERFRAMREERP
jgi:hypothetical protein